MAILLFYDQYIFSLLLFVVNNEHLFTKNLEFHNHDIRFANHFHLPIMNLTKYQNRSYYAGIKIINHLPTHIKCVANEIQVLNRP